MESFYPILKTDLYRRKHPGRMPGVSNGVDDSEMSYKQSFASVIII